MNRFAKPLLEVLEDRNAPGNLSYLLTTDFLQRFHIHTPTIRQQLTQVELAKDPIVSKIPPRETKNDHQEPRAIAKLITSFLLDLDKSNTQESYSILAFNNSPTPFQQLSLNPSAIADLANTVSFVSSLPTDQRFITSEAKVVPEVAALKHDGTTTLASILGQMTTLDSLVTDGGIGVPGVPGNPGGDPGNPGQPQPPEPPDEEQEVMINGNNDHGAAMVKYTGTLHINGEPQTGPNSTIEYPGYIPVNYEYDYKVGAQSPTANPMYSDPQIVPIKWKVFGMAAVAVTGEFVQWKLSYTAPTDGVQRLRFWDSSNKLVQFQANTNYTYTAPVPAMNPLPSPHGIWPAAVEGIEMSKAIGDAGVATLSLEYVQPVNPLTGVRPASIILNFKPVKFTVAPVIKSLKLDTLLSEQPKVYAAGNGFRLGPIVTVTAEFDTKTQPQYKFVQFVNSVVNLAGGGSKALTKIAGSPTPDQKWDYYYNDPNIDSFNLDYNLSRANHDFAFLDSTDGQVAYPGQGRTDYKMALVDSPGTTATPFINVAKYSMIFDTYACIEYANPTDQFKTVFFPMAKVTWKFTVDATNFVFSNGVLNAAYGQNNSLFQLGNASIYVHQFTGNQKLTGNMANTGYPLMDA